MFSCKKINALIIHVYFIALLALFRAEIVGKDMSLCNWLAYKERKMHIDTYEQHDIDVRGL